MDETLGSFKQINYLWHKIKYYYKNLDNKYFNDLLDIYPEFIRPNMLGILNYIKNKKIKNSDLKVIIFTNNKTSKEWVILIKNYFNYKINYDLFDNLICCYKKNNQIIEPNRTSNNKIFDDLIRCCNLHPKANIFFIDDNYHKYMNTNKLEYYKIKKYIYELDENTLFNRICLSNFIKNRIISLNLLEIIKDNYFYNINDNNSYIRIHYILSKKIINKLIKFFKRNKKNKTRQAKIYNSNKYTHKRYKKNKKYIKYMNFF